MEIRGLAKEVIVIPRLQKTEEEIKAILLVGNIRKRMEAKGITDKQMAICTRMAEKTFQRKKLHPEYFTYPELVRLMKKLDFPETEKLEVL